MFGLATAFTLSVGKSPNLSIGGEIDEDLYDGMMSWSVRSGSTESLECLLKMRPLNFKDGGSGWKYLQIACDNGQSEAMEMLKKSQSYKDAQKRLRGVNGSKQPGEEEETKSCHDALTDIRTLPFDMLLDQLRQRPEWKTEREVIIDDGNCQCCLLEDASFKCGCGTVFCKLCVESNNFPKDVDGNCRKCNQSFLPL